MPGVPIFSTGLLPVPDLSATVGPVYDFKLVTIDTSAAPQLAAGENYLAYFSTLTAPVPILNDEVTFGGVPSSNYPQGQFVGQSEGDLTQPWTDFGLSQNLFFIAPLSN